MGSWRHALWTPALVPSSPNIRSQGSLPSSKGRLRGRGNVAPSIFSHPSSRPSLLRWGRAVSLPCGGGCRQVVLGRRLGREGRGSIPLHPTTRTVSVSTRLDGCEDRRVRSPGGGGIPILPPPLKGVSVDETGSNPNPVTFLQRGRSRSNPEDLPIPGFPFETLPCSRKRVGRDGRTVEWNQHHKTAWT